MTPMPDNLTGYDSFWPAAEDSPGATDRTDPADAYAAFAAAAEPD